MPNSVQQTQALGQSIWYDNIRRGLITSGELARLIDGGISGVTSNPTIFQKAVTGSTDYDRALKEQAEEGKNALESYEALAVEDIQAAADLLRPIYDRTGGEDGYACLEVSPHLAHDTQGTIVEARRLYATLDRPNAMVKVPATPEGVPAIRELVGGGINVNVTLIFSRDVYRQVMEAYIGGLEDFLAAGGDLRTVASVASFFVSRVDTAVDQLVEERARKGDRNLAELHGRAAIANGRLAYQDFKKTFDTDRFHALRARGARVQRPLWASTGTKDPEYSDVLYVENLIGPETVNTVPPATLTAFLEHGHAEPTLGRDADEARRTIDTLKAAGIGMEEVVAKLLTDGVKAFADSFDKLMADIDRKRRLVLAREHQHPGVNLGDYLDEVEETLSDLEERHVFSRIWQKDYTVWTDDPEEITNRLGWLNVTEMMCEAIPALEAFVEEVRSEGYTHVVLLGMGGSSLGPEVLRQTFRQAQGRPFRQAQGRPFGQARDDAAGGSEYPELLVLDSTVPERVQSITDAIDPARTLFLVSSKSGGTIEPLSFYRHFRKKVEDVLGEKNAPANFVAITDPGTSLEAMAREHGFRSIFRNPPDIGGRYSVLSYFGLVPAALAGIDLTELLDRADCLREGCASYVRGDENPAALLGAAMGRLALKGRDKLTLITSPSVASFGLWVEQLIAESTGKDGKGIVPVAGEPLAGAEHYGDDRLFVYVRLEGDQNRAEDAAVEALEAAGQPVVRLDMGDRYDIGAEFFRWEMATAVAGSVIGIHPFDQPDVQGAKDATDEMLAQYQSTGQLPRVDAPDSVEDLLAQARSGDYLAIMAYVHQEPEVERALAHIRQQALTAYHLASTLGYGPRFLHSTGQLHKGGPNTGLFLQITDSPEQDVPIPGEGYSFGALAGAQARGDLKALQQSGRRCARISKARALETGRA